MTRIFQLVSWGCIRWLQEPLIVFNYDCNISPVYCAQLYSGLAAILSLNPKVSLSGLVLVMLVADKTPSKKDIQVAKRLDKLLYG